MTREKQIQWIIASVFFVLGGWCLLAPAQIAGLAFRPEYQLDHPLVPLVIGCFGAQAMISGLLAAFSTFTRATFLAYGIGILPFLGFNYYFYFIEPIFTRFNVLHAVGNLIFLVLCVYGYLLLSRRHE